MELCAIVILYVNEDDKTFGLQVGQLLMAEVESMQDGFRAFIPGSPRCWLGIHLPASSYRGDWRFATPLEALALAAE